MTLKALLVSDLHVDHNYHTAEEYAQQFLESYCEYVFIAGDTCDGIETFKKWLPKVLEVCSTQTFIMVAGNHDFYGCDITTVRAELLALSEHYSNFIYLDNSSHEILGGAQPTMVLGCTLWTDMNFYIEEGSSVTLDHWEFRALQYMNDFRYIKIDGRAFYPRDWQQEHWTSRQWLDRAIAMYKDTHRIIVMSHHAPHAKSIDSVYARYNLDHAYASHLIGKGLEYDNVSLWCHGHVHKKLDYQVGKTRVVANPKGYGNFSISQDFNTRLEI